MDIVIPTYNHPEMLKRCLRSVHANSHIPYTLIITDDCSPDKEMQKYLDELEVGDAVILRNTKQLGFPANVNQAASIGDREFICLLNEDTQVCVGWLEALLVEMDDPAVGIVGCKLIYPRERGNALANTIQHAGVANGDLGPYHIWRGMPKDYPPANVRRELNCVTFACALIRRRLWEDLGGLDEEYVGGQFEDVAMCWSARELGWKIVYTPACVVYHYEHGAGEEWVKKSETANRQRLMREFPAQPKDTHLFESVEKTIEGIAAYVHQIRAAAIQHTLQFRNNWEHPFRLSTMRYDELPEVEQAWAKDYAKRLLDVIK